jgi:putative DNA primase/helicase
MIKYDIQLNIATGHGAGSKVWKNKKTNWSNLATRLSDAIVTGETYKEFINASKQEQGKIKDVGGFVGGYLRNGRRSPSNVVYRQILTLDIDFAHLQFWDDFTLQFDYGAVLHGTHKHSDASPRYRLIIPLNREAKPDEYVAVARQIAGILGIELFDNTTFETNRLMFWPSVPKDVEYYYEFQDGPPVDVDKVLATYQDWTDTSLWPTAGKVLREIGDAVKKQQDPQEKTGIVGLFCRTHGITDAIDTYLADEYQPTNYNDRYTYIKGSTSGGLMIYDDTFAFSHHGTDPCSGKLCNAFDLVRIHKFGHLDDDQDKTGVKAPSFSAMEEFARKDENVKATLATEKKASAKYDFAQEYEEENETDAPSDFGDPDNDDWMTELESDRNGNYLSTAVNINIILANDNRLKNNFRKNNFDGKRYVFRSLPWDKIIKPRPIENDDYSGIRNYIESIYGIASALKIDDSLALEFKRNAFNPVKDYLGGLEWDGQKRIDTLLIDYFGADDNIYTREAIRKTLTGAVARIYKPGCKFDYVLTLVGDQGTKKSSFIKILGKNWASDSFTTVQGKEAFEQIQGVWIMEVAELAAMRKAELETVKHYFTKQEDQFRPAYGRVSEVFYRMCVFIATTNKWDFLSDPTGNRRFNPIDVVKHRITKDVWNDLAGEVDQIWAEAVALFKGGESLILSYEAEVIAKKEQVKHSETDERKGLIELFLDRKLPTNWDDKDLSERRVMLDDFEVTGTVEREYVCIAEIWCECLGLNLKEMTRYNTGPIHDLMKTMDAWESISSTKNFNIYGKQKYYRRKL